ncbi:uncharacterized protein LOC128547531 [Mercenaria mercenaria]|uniref:uncharacterized protein LOC128547531 n=1 Tax=Mercenaria mercenaria TaxID=6596 RepID=UPI00234FA402|nr:uncharacterized protein LOC128547531 [Mercenaria mercenaria]
MQFKPEKSRSLVLRKGQMQESARYRIKGQLIPTVKERAVKSLGKWFRESLNDKQSIQDRMTQMEDWLKAGQEGRGANSASGILGTASDWKLEADLKKQLKFPQEITVTHLRPDVVLWSASTKQVVMVELTVPWEERIEGSFERKLIKYQAPQTAAWREVGGHGVFLWRWAAEDFRHNHCGAHSVD